TPWSVALHESRYLYLVLLAIHVITLFVFIGSIIVQALRLMGLSFTSVPVSELLATMRPWSLAGFVAMAVTGSLLFFAAPAEKYLNVFFRIKLLLILLALLNVAVFHRYLNPQIGGWDTAAFPPTGARFVGAISLVLWAGVITAGRMIPYQDYWF
ncbi:MAG TPA: DUF6644 family protein, partial [Gammaproteobacteria bacterium]